MKFSFALFDTLLEPVFVLNVEGNIVYCNETASIVTGLTRRKLQRGMKLSEALLFAEPIEALTQLSQVVDATPYREVNFKNTNGDEGKVQVTLQPLEDEAGVPHWIMFVRDVTLEERLQKKYRAELEQKEDVIKDLEVAKSKLEDYSKNLEKMVEERTAEIRRLNQTMSALLDSLSQGFFLFDKEGLCLPVASKACELTLEGNPAGKKIWEVLRLPEQKITGFKNWMTTVFGEMLPFEDLAPLGPDRYKHSEGKHIQLEYFPLRAANNAIEAVVVMASDISRLIEAQQQAENERQQAKLIINLIQSKREIVRFIRDSHQISAELNKLLTQSHPSSEQMDEIFRHLHTLKGGAATFNIHTVAQSTHLAENILAECKENFQLDLWEKLKNQSQDIQQNLQSFYEHTERILGKGNLSEERQLEIALSEVSQILDRAKIYPSGEEAVEYIEQGLLMEPLFNQLRAYPELTRKLAEKLGKKVAPVRIEGAQIKIYPEPYQPLFASLVHAFRNTVDHAIESPEEREMLGKTAEGHITVLCEQNPRGDLLLQIMDDGQGINPQRIRQKLSERGYDHQNETDLQVIQHVFDSQLSTRDEVTDTSGRGVGMDAIKTEAQKLGGRAWVKSRVGKGTCLYVWVPYIKVTDQNRELKKVA